MVSRFEIQKVHIAATLFYSTVITIATNDTPFDLENRLADSDTFEALQERSPVDVADKLRFFYREVESRLALRDRAVESLLQQECEIGTRLHEIVREHGWIDEAADKERIQLNQELRNIGKERRDVYESAASDLLAIKQELMEALLEYRTLRRRQRVFADLLADPELPLQRDTAEGASYGFPPLPQYLVPPPRNAGRPDEERPPLPRRSRPDRGPP